MSIKSLKGRENLIGPSFEVELPIDLDPSENEGAIVYTDNKIHFYSDGQNWISFEELVANIRIPKILSPENGSIVANLTPTIVGIPRASLFTNSEDLERRFQVKERGNNWSNTIVDTSLKQDSFQIENGTLNFTSDYQVRIRDENPSTGNFSSWSPIVNFSTSNNVVTPENLFPQDGKIDVLKTDSLVASVFETAVFNENHAASEFEIENVNNNLSFNSGVISATRSIEIPNNFIDEQASEYRWRVRYQGDQSGFSAWSEWTNFFSVNPRVKKPQALIPNGNKPIDNITLQSSVFETVSENDTHSNSEWEVFLNNSLVYTSNTTSSDLITRVVPEADLTANEVHTWRVRHQGQILGFSEWSEETEFTPIEPFIKTPIPLSPSGNELLPELDFQLVANAFDSMFEADTHINSQFRVINSTTQLQEYFSGDTNSADTTHIVPVNSLQADQFYEWQVRYEGDQFGFSDWSAVSEFQIASRFIAKPTNISPQDNAQNVFVSQTILQGDAFEVIFGSDTHKDSQWQVFNDQTGQIVFDSTFDPVNLTSIQIPQINLQVGVRYRWRVRYRGDNTDVSDWSDFTRFNAEEIRIEKPTVLEPPDGATDIINNSKELVIKGSDFNVIAPSGTTDTHVSTSVRIKTAN